MSESRLGLDRLVMSYTAISQGPRRNQGSMLHTSNDCEYQSLTFLIDGISFSSSGKSPSSCTLCASRMGSSSERNWEARNRVPGQRAVSVFVGVLLPGVFLHL